MMFALLRLLVKLLPLLRLLIFSESPVSAPAFMKGSYNHTVLLHGPSLVDLSAVYCLWNCEALASRNGAAESSQGFEKLML